MKIYMRIYIGERIFKCDVCGRVFCDSRNLWVYKKIYTDERDYRCDECGVVFRWSCNLVRYMKTVYDGMKEFICS